MADELKASPTYPGQESIGRIGQVAERLGISLQEAMSVLAKEGNSPIKAFLGNMLLADPLKSAGTALQDYTGTPREITPDQPYSRLISGKGMNMRLDPRALDVAGFAAPIAAVGAKAGVKGAKALGPTAAKMAEDYLLKTGQMLPAMKPKGGNFPPEGTKAIEGLKLRNRGTSTKDPEEYMAEMKATYTPEALSRMSPETQQEVKVAMQELNRSIAVNQFIDKQLTRYVKNEMATPEDPIRALAEKGTLHFDAPQVDASDVMDMKRQEFAAGNNEKWGYGESQLAQNWEDAADFMIDKVPARRYQNHQGNRLDMTNEPGWEWLSKVSPDTPLYGIKNGFRSSVDSLGFPHLIDELRNATNPASGLPRELLLKPESLSRLSVPQAVERVAKINEWRAAQMEAAKKASREGIPVHKEFPEGYKWMASPDTVADAKALQYIQDVGCEGGWCTQGEELAKQYGGGGNQLFVLHDPSGKAVTQISVKPNSMHSDLRALNDERLIDPSKLSPEEFSTLYADMRKRGLASSALGDQASVVRSGLVAHPDYPNWISPKDNFSEAQKSIVEIKGKQNRAPSEEYLPYVQDFVRSGKWSDVGDLQNTGLYKTHGSTGLSRDISPGMSGNARQLAYGRASAAGEIQPYMTKAEIETVMKKHAPEDIWSRDGEPMTEADITGPWEPEPGMKRGGPVSQDVMNMAVMNQQVQKRGAGGVMKGVKALMNAAEEAKRLKAAAEAAGVLPKGQQAVLSAAENRANLEKFLALSGEKRRMYHGSKEPNIAEFKTRKDMTDESNMTGHYADERDAVFVSPEPDFTKNFSMMGYTDEGMAPTTYPVYVQIGKPFDFDNPEHLKKVKETYLDMYHNPESELFDPYMLPSERSMAVHSFNKRTDALPNDENNWARIENAQFQEVLKDVGFDSFYTRERGTKNLGVYEPNKIKSAIGNRGTYDTAEPDMSKAKGGSVSQDVMNMAVMNQKVQHRQVGGAIRGLNKGASNLAMFLQKLAAEAPMQAQQIRKALGQAFTTGSEHSVVGPTHSVPNEPRRVGRIITQGKDYAVAPSQSDIQNAVKGKSSIVDFHTHPNDTGRAFSVSPSAGDFHFSANEYFPGRQSRELRTLIASPADAELRAPTEYSFFATDNPGKAFDRRAYEAAVYELQRSGKNTFKDVLIDPRFSDYFESGGSIGDWAQDISPLALLKLRESQGLGRGELKLSGRALTPIGGTNIELYDMMQPAATEFLRGKGFEKGGRVSPEATRLRKAITNEQRIKN